jgi:hypothetical protein
VSEERAQQLLLASCASQRSGNVAPQVLGIVGHEVGQGLAVPEAIRRL